MPWGYVAAAGLSYLSQRSASSASKSAARRMAGVEERRLALLEKLAKPGMIARGFLTSRIGKESPRLAAGYRQGLSRLSRLGERTVRGSQLYWGGKGNIGRARGEKMRIRRATERAKGELALGYAREQEQHRLAPAFALAGQGAGGYEQAVMGLGQSQQLLGQGQQGLYADFASILGEYMAYANMRKLFRRPATPERAADQEAYEDTITGRL